MTINLDKYYVGIDVSKGLLDVFVAPTNEYFQVENNAEGIGQLVKKFSTYPAVLIVMESTGGYEKTLAYSLAKASYPTVVANPRIIRNCAKAMGRLAKTDKIDAEIIASFAEKFKPQANVSVDENQRALAEQHQRRQQITGMIKMEKNRLSTASKSVEKSVKRMIRVLERELGVIDKVLKKMIEADPTYTTNRELLESIKGVGKVTATGLLACLPELGKLSNKKISALAGLAPYNCDSGRFKGKRCIWGGRATVRSVLYMSTLVATKHNPQIKKFYERLQQNGKSKMIALVACMRKLLSIMNAMITYQEAWRICEN